MHGGKPMLEDGIATWLAIAADRALSEVMRQAKYHEILDDCGVDRV